MSKPIERSVASPSGTTVAAERRNVVLSRTPGEPTRPHPLDPHLAGFRSAIGQRDWETARGHLEGLTQRFDRHSAGMPPAVQKELAEALKEAVALVEPEDERSTLDWVLGFLLLGIPFLVDALVTTDVEYLRDQGRSLRERAAAADTYDPGIDADRAIMGTTRDGDVSGVMNLYVGNPLLGTTSKLAGGLGGPFVGISDAVATHHYSASATVKPADFEVSTGVILVEKISRHIVSQDAGGFFLQSLDGRAVFTGADGKLYFEPPGIEPPELVPADRHGAVRRRIVPEISVGARARLPNDPDPRPNMRFTWHGESTGDIDVGWWGHCESSGMLGSMGLMPARQPVTLYDEHRDREVELSADDVTRMMVFMGRANYFGLQPAAGAGELNRSRDEVDGDVPYAFHLFVMGQIAAGLPFNLEAHSFHEAWNYPIREASIQPVGQRKRLRGGDTEQRYEMELTKSNGKKVTYFYSLTYDARGTVKDSAWDLEASATANGRTHAVPDGMKSYLSPSRTAVALNEGVRYHEDNRWTSEAVAIVGDLYFASHAQPGDGEGRVYAVRTEDGRLLQMSRGELATFRAERAALKVAGR